MAWSEWHTMNQQDINKIPQSGGVYQLNSDSGILYFGQSDNLRRRLGEHLDSDDSCIRRATTFCYQTTNDPEGLEQNLLSNYKNKHGNTPPCND